MSFAAALLSTLLLAQATPEKAPVLLDASTLVPELRLDLRYAQDDNFLKKAVYPKDARCLLVPDAAKKLVQAAEALKAKGYALKVYDCYRPRSVQREMWKLFPKPGYVANPDKGSKHNRGAAVDLTLVTLDKGTEVEMPTPFDTFTPKAHHAATLGISAEAQKNRELLRATMEQAGFKKNRMEWWHYELPQTSRYPLLDEPLSSP